VFVPGKPFQPSLMFAGKAGAYPTWEGLPGEKRSGLIRKSVNFGREKFNRIDPWIIFFQAKLTEKELESK
jgi:hypothetical protein